jgi:hypothetical protein
MKVRLPAIVTMVLGLGACSSLYYGTMETMGVHKRDIMVDRVEAARDTQQEAKNQFLAAMELYKSVVMFQGGDLEDKYNKLSAMVQKSEAEAEAVRERIDAVENVYKAVFGEWRSEIKRYNSDALRTSSQKKYDIAHAKYAELIKAMNNAESKLEPVLVPLRDQVLFMKHNLNAKAIAGLGDELVGIETNVDILVAEMEKAIAEADMFIAALQTE